MRKRVRSSIKSRPGDICIFWVTLMSSKSDLFFTHCGIVMRYADIDLAHNWPRWWLLAWWLQSITRTWWTSLHQWGLLAFTWGQFQRKCWTISILDIIKITTSYLWYELKITYLKLQPRHSESNELIHCFGVVFNIKWYGTLLCGGIILCHACPCFYQTSSAGSMD